MLLLSLGAHCYLKRADEAVSWSKAPTNIIHSTRKTYQGR
jgi:hypothetical protein